MRYEQENTGQDEPAPSPPKVGQTIREKTTGLEWKVRRVWQNGHITVSRYTTVPERRAALAAGEKPLGPEVWKGASWDRWAIAITLGEVEVL